MDKIMIKQLEDQLMNGCKSEKLARCSVAIHSHIDNHTQQMSVMNDINHSWIKSGLIYSENPEKLLNSEVLFAGFYSRDDANIVALIYADEDLVVLCSETDVEDEYYLEAYCAMTTVGFFKYLNTIPNPYPFAITNKPMLNATPLGIELLSTLAQSN
jgi:hypothetical protein